jgi:hypothetical protein
MGVVGALPPPAWGQVSIGSGRATPPYTLSKREMSSAGQLTINALLLHDQFNRDDRNMAIPYVSCHNSYHIGRDS